MSGADDDLRKRISFIDTVHVPRVTGKISACPRGEPSVTSGREAMTKQ